MTDCTVIIPVGPGHELIVQQAMQSVMKAAETPGPFRRIHAVIGDDTKGDKGRSFTRNRLAAGVIKFPWAVTFSKDPHGEDRAMRSEWLFFLDADDLMYPEAFKAMKKRVDDYDAVWGTIIELGQDGHLYQREGQPQVLKNYRQLLHMYEDPIENCYRTLQMGHFVRRDAFMEFDESMDSGEDWDYYIRMWQNKRCMRVDRPLMINRRGAHSQGPRSAHGGHWREAVEKIMVGAREDFEASQDGATASRS